MKKIISLALVFLVFGVSSCSNETKNLQEGTQKYPLDNKEQRRADRGKVFGDDGGLFGGNLLDGGSSAGAPNNIVGGVNAYLWRASLDVISFMPLSSADAVGGIIITDWYESPSARGERMKANINITTKELRASGVKVSLFKQKRSGGRWRDGRVSKDLEEKLEDKILARAREIKIGEERR